MDKNLIDNRISKLRTVLNTDKEAVLLTDEINIGYFSGFFHSEGYLLVTKSECMLFVDFRYFEAAEKLAVSCKVICFDNLFTEISDKLSEYNINSLYFETTNITLSQYNRFKIQLKEIGIECISSNEVDEIISDIRCIKDPGEISRIQQAQKITEKSYLEVLNFLKPGVSERKIAIELEYLIKANGGQDISFDLITITGKKTSLPHGVPDDSIVKKGDFFTFDIGAVYDGYHSDMTRTVAVSYANEEQKKIYDIVLKAQLAALEAVKSGVSCSSVDKAARNIIENEGYGKYFGHSTGHGVGLNIHEQPTVSFKSNTFLKEGMVITDEPGIYLPNKFGVRIEDMLCVTKDGYKNFVSLTKELLII